MSTALKCPNPSCPYLFDPSTVPPGVVLACPRCGMRFTLGTPGAAPPGSPGFPGYAHGGYAAPNPVEAAFGGMTPDTARADDEDGPRLPVRESPLQTVLLVLVASVALTAAGIAVWYKMTAKSEREPQDGAGYRFKDVNLFLEPPPKPWAADGETKSRLDAPFVEVYRRDNPEAYMAFGARDFRDHEPRPRELRDVLTNALDRLLESGTRKEYPEDAPRTWLGRDAQGFKFTGLMKGTGNVEGEAIAVSYKGVGYWFLAWTGANEIYQEQKSAFEVGRSGCRLLDGREDWKPTVTPLVAFKNTEIGYTILDSEHVWEEIEDEAEVKGQDAKADKYLAVYADPKKRNKEIKARLVVAVLDVSGDDPLAAAQSHVERHANELAELQGRYVFKKHTDPPEGDPTNPAEGSAPVQMLRATNERNPAYSWLYAVSAVRVGEKTVVVYAWCPWANRAEFDTKLIQIAKSLRADR